MEAARALALGIEAPCNAVGTCGKCKVRLADPLGYSEIERECSHRLSEIEQKEGYVLACQSAVLEDIGVFWESKADENRKLQILAGGESFNYHRDPYVTKQFDGRNTIILGDGKPLGSEPGDTAGEVYGIALDIGTTTLVAELVNLKTGEHFAHESMLNPQSAYAQDVLSRIHFASDDGLTTLYEAFLGAFAELRDRLVKRAEINPAHIYDVVYSGNTTMLHLAAGIDPTPLGSYPYHTNLSGNSYLPAKRLGISPFGSIYLPPIISAFVGADITSGVLASRLTERKGVTFFIDIGTNGEMAVAQNGKLAATSTAAGPAFEGMNITCGMRAAPGAVEEFSIDEEGNVNYKTIGGMEPIGICGSGLLDIVGELVRTGIVGKNGRFVKESEARYSEKIKQQIRLTEGKTTFYLTDKVYLTQKDIRQVQLAKGAVYAGIVALLEQLNVPPESVDEVLIAGSFGYHLRERSLLDIRLLPRVFKGKVRFIGNTSQSGAAAFLLNKTFREQMKALVESVEKVELANTPDFEKLFVKSLNF